MPATGGPRRRLLRTTWTAAGTLAALALVGLLLLPSGAALPVGSAHYAMGAPVPAGPAGRTLYVAPQGHDGASCTSSAPCRQISEALARATPGSTVIVRNGVYLGVLIRGLQGTPGAPIVVRAPDRGAQVLPTEDFQNRTGAFVVLHARDLVLDGFQTFHAPQYAVQLVHSDHITLANLTLGNSTLGGVLVAASNFTTLRGDWVYGSHPGGGVELGADSQNATLVGNTIARNGGPGIALVSGNGPTSSLRDATVENNILFRNGAAGVPAIRLVGVTAALVANNLLYGNGGDGIVLGSPAQGDSNVTVAYNSVVDPAKGAWALRIVDSEGPILVRDNILVHAGSLANGIWYATNADVLRTASDHNILEGVSVGSSANRLLLAAWQEEGHEADSLSATPQLLFVDPAASEFELLPAAVAVGHGLPIAGLSTDLGGTVRPTSGPTDIGAFEHTTGSPGSFALQIAPSRISGVAPLRVGFLASAPAAQVPVGYRWNFGDGTNGTGPAPIHVFERAGVYEVQVAATDRRGWVSQAEVTITVTSSGTGGVPITFRPVGLPPGAAWAIQFGTLALTGVGPLTVPAVAPGTYTAQPRPVLAAEPAILYAAGPSVTFAVAGPASVDVAYAPYLDVALAASGPGTVGPATGWFPIGAHVTISAEAAAGAEFVGWSGSGTNSYTGSSASVRILLVDSIRETALFRSIAVAPPGAAGSGAAPAHMGGSFAAWSLSMAVIVGTAALAAGLVAWRRKGLDRRLARPIALHPALQPWCEALTPTTSAIAGSPPPWSESP